jgi:uncharacterized membrane protein HdeD (DUF308 family)
MANTRVSEQAAVMASQGIRGIKKLEQLVVTNSDTVYRSISAPWRLVLIEGILAIITGLYLLYAPVSTPILLMKILGIFWLAVGIVSVLGALVFSENRLWKLLSGILSIIAGIVLLIYPVYSPFVVLGLLVIFIGVWAITGSERIASSFRGEGWGTGIFGIITIILGLLLLTTLRLGLQFYLEYLDFSSSLGELEQLSQK